MKHLIFILTFFISFSSTAQVSYQHYLDSQVRWTYEFSIGGLGYSFYNFSEYSFQGDTLINNTWYWNVWQYSRSSDNLKPYVITYMPVFGMRETPDKKFYQYSYSTNQESLMNDFNLKLGDTLESGYFGGMYNTFFVNYIDTVKFGNEKRLFFRSIYPSGVVEGIGFVARNGNFNEKMLCFQNKQGTYPEDAPYCKWVTPTTAPTQTDDFAVYPNPASTEVGIQLPEHLHTGTLSYSWYAADGRLHSAGEVETNTARIQLPLNKHTPGFYLLLIGRDDYWKKLKVVVTK